MQYSRKNMSTAENAPRTIAELDSNQVEAFIADSPDVNRRLASAHAVGNFVLLGESDSWNGYHPGQNPLQVRVQGKQLPIETTDYIANLVNPRYTETRDAQLEDEEVVEKVHEIADHLQSGGNLMIITPHVKNLIDVAFAEKYVADLLEIIAKQKTDRAIMVAKPISFLGYELDGATVPALNVLQALCNSILLGITRTESSRDIVSELPKPVVDFMNGQNYRYSERRLDKSRPDKRQSDKSRPDKGGWVVGMVPYATTQEKRDEQGNLILGTISPGTKKLMQRPDVKVLPVFANFLVKTPVVALPLGLLEIRDEDDINSLTKLLAETHQKYTPKPS